MNVSLFVCLFVKVIFLFRELGKLHQEDMNTKLTTANLSYIGGLRAITLYY